MRVTLPACAWLQGSVGRFTAYGMYTWDALGPSQTKRCATATFASLQYIMLFHLTLLNAENSVMVMLNEDM